MFKKLKIWWDGSKLKLIWDKIGKPVRQFLRYAYAAQLSYLVAAVLFSLTASLLIGILLIGWGVILLIAEFRQQKAEKATVVTLTSALKAVKAVKAVKTTKTTQSRKSNK